MVVENINLRIWPHHIGTYPTRGLFYLLVLIVVDVIWEIVRLTRFFRGKTRKTS